MITLKKLGSRTLQICDAAGNHLLTLTLQYSWQLDAAILAQAAAAERAGGTVYTPATDESGVGTGAGVSAEISIAPGSVNTRSDPATPEPDQRNAIVQAAHQTFRVFKRAGGTMTPDLHRALCDMGYDLDKLR